MRTYVVDKVNTGEVKIACTAYGCQNYLSRAAIQSLISHDESATNVYKGLCDIADKPVEAILAVSGLVEFYGSLKTPRVMKSSSGEVAAPSDSDPKLIDVCVATPTDFYHYDCNGDSDRGWGCAYRDLQMIISNLIHRGIALKIPNILQIQQALVDSKFSPSSILGSQNWIEPSHCQDYLKQHKIQSRYTIYDFRNMESSSSPSIASQLEAHLWQHFRNAEWRTPVMFDDGIMAYNLCGIATRINVDGSKSTLVLRFDPHARVTKAQRLEHFQEGGGVGVEWMDFDRAFMKHKKWMLLFPLQSQTDPPNTIPTSMATASTTATTTSSVSFVA